MIPKINSTDITSQASNETPVALTEKNKVEKVAIEALKNRPTNSGKLNRAFTWIRNIASHIANFFKNLFSKKASPSIQDVISENSKKEAPLVTLFIQSTDSPVTALTEEIKQTTNPLVAGLTEEIKQKTEMETLKENLKVIKAMVVPPKFSNKNNNCWFHAALQILWSMGPHFQDLVNSKLKQVSQKDYDWRKEYSRNPMPLLNSLKKLAYEIDNGNTEGIFDATEKLQKAVMHFFPDFVELNRHQDSGEFLLQIFAFFSATFYELSTQNTCAIEGLEDISTERKEKGSIINLHFEDERDLQTILDKNFSRKRVTDEENPTIIQDIPVADYYTKTKIVSATPPEFLFVMLVRFEGLSKKQNDVYLPENNHVDFSKAFGLKDYDSTYDYALHGTILHEGDVGGGHYKANVLGVDPQNGLNKWYHCDDAAASKTEALTNKNLANYNKQAYFYLFKRVGGPGKTDPN